MRDETSSDAHDAPESRPQYWIVGLILLGLVLVLLGGAIVVDQQLRPRVDVQPVATLPRGEAATAEPPLRPSPTILPVPTVLLEATANMSGSDPRLVQEIEDAYRRYWDVYSAALFNLDTARLTDVAAAEELRLMREEIEDFRRRDRAVRAVVTHNYLILDVTENSATVYDELQDSSFLINPLTKLPREGPDTRHLSKDIFYLQKLDGIWKVVRSLRQEGQRP